MGSMLTVDLLRKIQQGLKEVERLEFQSGTDSEGEPASWIWIVLKHDAPASAWTWENRERIRSNITKQLKDAGVSDWVYVRFRSADEEAPSTAVSST